MTSQNPQFVVSLAESRSFVPQMQLGTARRVLIITRGNKILVMVLLELPWHPEARGRVRVFAVRTAKVSWERRDAGIPPTLRNHTYD